MTSAVYSEIRSMIGTYVNKSLFEYVCVLIDGMLVDLYIL